LNFKPARTSKFKVFKTLIWSWGNFESARGSKYKIFQIRSSSWSWISSKLENRNSKFSQPEFRAEVEFRASSKIEIQNSEKANFELDFNLEPARRTKFKISKPDFRAGVEFRVRSKIEIQNFPNPIFKLELNFEQARRSKFKILKTRVSSWSWISSQLEDQNSKFSKPEIRAGVEFRASLKIEIQKFENANFELELNFEPARRSKFKIFQIRISSWSWISSQLEDRNLKLSKPEFRAGVQFEVARRSKFKILKIRISSWDWISSQLEDQNLNFWKPEFRAGVEIWASSKIEIENY
jgi:hypothetical protein